MTSDAALPSATPTGSPSGEPVFLVVGQLGKPHGIRGEISMTILTGFPERIGAGTRLFIGPEYHPINVRQRRPSGNKLLLTLDGVQSREQAETLRNLMVYVRGEEVPPLPEGEYYHHELLGLQVLSEEGQDLGVLEEILPTGANDVFLIRLPDGRELLLPVIEGILLDVDFQKEQLRVHVLPGAMPE
jgi:16S rRNA processing protein RimM